MAERKTQLLVIGGGPGGYVAAMKSAMLGMEVTLVERDKVGGTCLNRGCIPTKAILHSAELYHQMQNSADTGITAENIRVDMAQVDRHKQKVVDTLVKGVEGLLRARKVTLVSGEAAFAGPNTVTVQKSDGSSETIRAEKIILAAGSKPSAPPIPGIDGKNVITSTEALQVKELPESMIIIGGGVIGMEIGAAYSRFGVKICVIEALERILQSDPAERIVIVTHGGPIAAIMQRLFPEKKLNRYEWQPACGEGYLVQITGGTLADCCAAYEKYPARGEETE